MNPARERFLPLTGALAGAGGAIAYVGASLWMPHAVAVLAAIAVAAILTRARGERALAAMCDAGGRAGSDAGAGPRGAGPGGAGITGIALLVVARLELLSTIDPAWIAAALVGAAAVSRGLAAIAVIGMPAQQPRSRVLDFAVPLALGVLPVVALQAWGGEIWPVYKACALALLAAALARRVARRRLAHERPAALLAIAQLAEIAFLAGLLAGLPASPDPEGES